MIHLDFARQIHSGRLCLLSTEALTPEILRGGETPARRFDPKSAAPFVNKSVSEATRHAYGRALREFFQFVGMKHPSEVAPHDVVLWRDRLRSQRKSAATVAFKLSVVRSFFEYLKAAAPSRSTPPRRSWSRRPGFRQSRPAALREGGALPAIGAGQGKTGGR
jgi:integrase